MASQTPMHKAVGLRGTDQQDVNEDCILCHVTEVDAMFDQDDNGSSERVQYACHYDNPLGYRGTLSVELPHTALEEYNTIIQTGTAEFCIPNRYRQGESLVVPDNVRLELIQRRRLASHKDFTTGTKRVLAVRITSSFGEEPDETAEDIGRAVFGTDWDASALTQPSSSVVDQYRKVSHGQLHLMAAVGENIYNGVIEVQLNVTVAGQEVQQGLTAEILAATQRALGADLSEVAEHFIFCIPSLSLLSGKDTWTAFTYLFEPVSPWMRWRFCAAGCDFATANNCFLSISIHSTATISNQGAPSSVL